MAIPAPHTSTNFSRELGVHYLQSRLKELSPNRCCIGNTSLSIWGKETPLEEKRQIEEVCRAAENNQRNLTKKPINANNKVNANRGRKTQLQGLAHIARYPNVNRQRKSTVIRPRCSSRRSETFLTISSIGRSHPVSGYSAQTIESPNTSCCKHKPLQQMARPKAYLPRI